MDLPFETKIRQFMWKINAELERVEERLDKLALEGGTNSKKVKSNRTWRAALDKLSSQCSSAISSNARYRIELEKN